MKGTCNTTVRPQLVTAGLCTAVLSLLASSKADGLSDMATVLLLLAAGTTVQNGGASATNMPRVTNMLPQRAIGTAADAAFSK